MCTFFLAALAIDQRRIDAGRWNVCFLEFKSNVFLFYFRDFLCCWLHPGKTTFPCSWVRPKWLTLAFHCRHLGRLISTWPARCSQGNPLIYNSTSQAGLHWSNSRTAGHRHLRSHSAWGRLGPGPCVLQSGKQEIQVHAGGEWVLPISVESLHLHGAPALRQPDKQDHRPREGVRSTGPRRTSLWKQLAICPPSQCQPLWLRHQPCRPALCPFLQHLGGVEGDRCLQDWLQVCQASTHLQGLRFDGQSGSVDRRRGKQKICYSINFPCRQELVGEVFSNFSEGRAVLPALRIIIEDMLLNVACTFVAIFIMSFIFTVDLTISVYTLFAVMATVVNTAGLLYFWGASIDPFFAVATINSFLLLLLFFLWPGVYVCNSWTQCWLRCAHRLQLPNPGSCWWIHSQENRAKL